MSGTDTSLVEPTCAPRSALTLESETGVDPRRWRYLRWVYHGDLDTALCQVIAPWAEELRKGSWIDRFYFVRYELGGPHLRLRWRLKAAADAEVECFIERRLTQRLASWLTEQPVIEPWTDEKTHRINRQLLGADPAPDEDVVLPHLGRVYGVPRFEVQRYGGARLLPAALELFDISSSRVLTLMQHPNIAVSKRVPWLLVEWLQWSLAMADDEEDFLRLVAYSEQFFGPEMAACRQQGNDFFNRQADALTQLAGRCLSEAHNILSGGAHDSGFDHLPAARHYARLLDPTTCDRWYARVSHLHMTANRLGGLNPQEAYWSRLADLACRRLRDEYPETWESLWKSIEDQEQRS